MQIFVNKDKPVILQANRHYFRKNLFISLDDPLYFKELEGCSRTIEIQESKHKKTSSINRPTT